MGVRFVAEVGSSHSGSILRAEELIEAAGAAGFWGVKFQHFRVERLFHSSARLSNPDIWARRKLEVPLAWHTLLSHQAHERGMAYGISVFDEDDVRQLLPHTDFWKASSYDLLRLQLLQQLRWRPLIISTGMATMDECMAARNMALHVNSDVSFLHCVSSYPTPKEEANLKAIDTMQKRLGVPVGWSDHTVNEEVIARAVWRWRAPIVEMHIDLDDGKGLEGSEHCWPISKAKAIIERVNSRVLPETLQRASALDGDGVKQPQPCELNERQWRADPEDGLRPMASFRRELSERT